MLQVMQTAFVEKTAQLQALQQQVTGQQHASPELAALHQDMLNAQVTLTRQLSKLLGFSRPLSVMMPHMYGLLHACLSKTAYSVKLQMAH